MLINKTSPVDFGLFSPDVKYSFDNSYLLTSPKQDFLIGSDRTPSFLGLICKSVGAKNSYTSFVKNADLAEVTNKTFKGSKRREEESLNSLKAHKKTINQIIKLNTP